MGRISNPGGKDFLVLTAKNFLVGRSSRQERFPGRGVRSFVRSMVTGFCTSLKVKRPCRRVPRDQLLLLSPRTPKLYTILISIINMKQQTPGVLKLSLPGMQQTQEDWVGRHLHAEVNSCDTNVPSGMRFLLNTALLHL